MKPFGYVEELALTKLAVAELEEQFEAAKGRRGADMILWELVQNRAHLAKLEEVE